MSYLRGTSLLTLTLALALGACGPAANPGTVGDGDDQTQGPEIRLPPREQSFDCNEIPETGECREDVAFYCDRRSNAIVEKRCVARNLACDDTKGGARCVDETGTEQEVPGEVTGGGSGGDTGTVTGDPCGSITNDGTCQGNKVVYCSLFSNTLAEIECIDGQETCGASSDDPNYFYCRRTGCPADLIDGDACDDGGATYRWCEFDPAQDKFVVKTEDCAAQGLVCNLDQFNLGLCEEPPPPSCSDLGARGECFAEDTKVRYCLDESSGIQTKECVNGKTCQLTGINEGYYDCI